MSDPAYLQVSVTHHACQKSVDFSKYVAGYSILGGDGTCVCGESTTYYNEFNLNPLEAHRRAQERRDRLAEELREAQIVLDRCRSNVEG
jgi:hypothetical protein